MVTIKVTGRLIASGWEFRTLGLDKRNLTFIHQFPAIFPNQILEINRKKISNKKDEMFPQLLVRLEPTESSKLSKLSNYFCMRSPANFDLKHFSSASAPQSSFPASRQHYLCDNYSFWCFFPSHLVSLSTFACTEKILFPALCNVIETEWMLRVDGRDSLTLSRRIHFITFNHLHWCDVELMANWQKPRETK